MEADAKPQPESRRSGKSADAFRTISEVAGDLELPQHVLRFWESKFPQVKPLKRGGGRRYYRPEDMVLLRRIRELLYTQGYTIRGVQKLLRENGGKAVANGDVAGPANGEATSPANGEAASPDSGADEPAARAPATRGNGGGDGADVRRRALGGILAELEAIRDQLRDK